MRGRGSGAAVETRPTLLPLGAGLTLGRHVHCPRRHTTEFLTTVLRLSWVIRVVIRNGFTRDLADLFLSDLDHHWRALAGHQHDCPPLVPEGKRQSFSH